MKLKCETRHIVIAEPEACAPVVFYEIHLKITTAAGPAEVSDVIATQHGAEEAAYRLFLECQSQADANGRRYPEEYEIISAAVIYRAALTTIKHPELLNIAAFPEYKPAPYGRKAA